MPTIRVELFEGRTPRERGRVVVRHQALRLVHWGRAVEREKNQQLNPTPPRSAMAWLP